MPHRSPTRSDIGKTVEVSMDGHEWQTGTLEQWTIDKDGNWFYVVDPLSRHGSFEFCRVPYDRPDPIAELSILADELAEAGHDEAARVLMANIEARELIDRIVIDEGIDAGVIMLSHESPTHHEERFGRQVSVYNHEHFSELGDALVALSRLIKGESNDNCTQVTDR